MALAQINSAAIIGLSCQIVTVEVDVASKGLSAFQVVGLPDTAINESRERVRAAIVNNGIDFPARRIIVNLAPADLAKSGPIYDLPIAIAILIAWGYLENFPADSIVVGELSLDGQVRSVNGVLSIVKAAKLANFSKIFLPQENWQEARFIEGIEIFPVTCLKDILLFSENNFAAPKFEPQSQNNQPKPPKEKIFDLSQIRGQQNAKRALEIAAAGAHNLIFHGPPGSGKTLLAKSLASILPKMTKEEVLEVTEIYSISGLLTKKAPLVAERPFRSPHHSSSASSLIGGGAIPKPGEITLAHRGVLFLDELPEFHRDVLEALRQPLEGHEVTVSRVAGSCEFPAQFILVAAYNPCPCGNLYDPKIACRCTGSQIIRYQKKLSGPLLDRIDLHVEVPRVKTEELIVTENQLPNNSTSEKIQRRVQLARDKQTQRLAGLSIQTNSEMSPLEISQFCQLDEAGQNLIKTAVDRLNLSARGYHRVLKTARTIADLDQSKNINQSHLTEALQYRPNRV